MAMINQSPAGQSSVSVSTPNFNALAATGELSRSRGNTGGTGGGGGGGGPVVPTTGQIWPSGF